MDPKNQPCDEPLIGIAELAEWLDVSEHTVKKWASAGPESHKIPRLIRLNGVTKFDRADVRAWLQTKAVG